LQSPLHRSSKELAIASVFRFCALRAQKRNTKVDEVPLDLEQTFLDTMVDLEQHIAAEIAAVPHNM
jgi:hypothetical protein